MTNYYKIFKGNGGIPSEITIVGINGENVIFVRGHHTEEDAKSCVFKMTCSKKHIITKISDKQRKRIETEEKAIQKKEELVNKILTEFGVEIPFLSWSMMELEELEEYYEELKILNH